MEASTRIRLLAAAERILVEQGVNALSVRRIGDRAGLNPTLVTYHFKSILKLLDELCSLNLDPILAEWRKIDPERMAGRTLDELLHAWLEPMLHPAAFTPGGRALIVLDEIASHGEPALQAKVLGAMDEFVPRLLATMAPLVPQLPEDALRARLRFISAAVLGPPPRIHSGGSGLDELGYLVPFARAALTG